MGLSKQMKLLRFTQFSEWLSFESAKSQAQIEARLKRIEEFDHFGDSRDLGAGLAELKWSNGRRIYFSMSRDTSGRVVILILGGNKNGQDKDIRTARKILATYRL
jgi:putative addiction module killer protein